MNQISRASGFTSALLVTALQALPALAGAQLEEVVVTAQKREQGVNDVGITVNVFTAESLDNYGVNSAEDLEALVPGLTITNAQPAGVPVYTIRGVGFNDFTTTSSSTVGLYFNETNIPYAVMSRGALFDIERIEVLKGPQGDLYGRNTTAGQINFISNKPTEEFEAGASIGYSRFDLLDLEGYVSGALSQTVRGRIAVKGLTSGEGWQRSVSRDEELGEKDEWAIRGMLDIDVTDAVSLLLEAHYFSDQSDNMAAAVYELPGATGFGTPPALVGRESEFIVDNIRDADWTPGFRPERDNEMVGVSARLEWDFGPVLLTSITSYDHFERDETYDTSGVPVSDADSRNRTDIKVFTQELRLSSNTDSDLYWIAGIYYSEDKIDENYFLGFDDTILGINLQNLYQQDADTIAAYGHVEWDFAPDWRLTLGARYTEEDRDWTGCTGDTGDGTLAAFWNGALIPFVINLTPDLPNTGPVAPGDCITYNDLPGTPGFGTFTPFSDQISISRWMWKASLDYRVHPDVLLFATLSTGFKSGGFNGAAAQFHGQLVPFEPEKLMAYEIGMKATLLDGAMQANLSAFYYDYDDKQELGNYVSPIGPIVGTLNIDKSEIYGAELELHWQVTRGLTLDAGVAWLESRIREFQAVDIFASTFRNEVFFDASGAELDNAPNWQANATLAYTWSITGGLNLTLAGDVSHKGDNDGSLAADDGFIIPDYTLLNARARLSDAGGKWDVTLWGRNVTNEYYWHSASQSNGPRVRLNGMPATYGVNVAYRF